jgi:hypothetical protein
MGNQSSTPSQEVMEKLLSTNISVDMRRAIEEIENAKRELNSFNREDLSESDITRTEELRNIIISNTRRIGWSNYNPVPVNLEMFGQRLFNNEYDWNLVVTPDMLPEWVISLGEEKVIWYSNTITHLCKYIIDNNCLIIPSSCPENGNQLYRSYLIHKNNTDSIAPEQLIKNERKMLFFNKDERNIRYINEPDYLSTKKSLINITEDYNGLNECVNRKIVLFLNFDNLNYSDKNRTLNVELITIISELIKLKILNNKYDFSNEPKAVRLYQEIINKIDSGEELDKYDKKGLEDYFENLFSTYGVSLNTSIKGLRRSYLEWDELFVANLNEILNIIEKILSIYVTRNNELIRIPPEVLSEIFNIDGSVVPPNVQFNLLGYYHSSMWYKENMTDEIVFFQPECTIKTERVLLHPRTTNLNDITSTRLFYPLERDTIVEETKNSGFPITYYVSRGGVKKLKEKKNKNDLYYKIFNTTEYDFNFKENKQVINLSSYLQIYFLNLLCNDISNMYKMYTKYLKKNKSKYENKPEYAMNHLTQSSTGIYAKGIKRKTSKNKKTKKNKKNSNKTKKNNRKRRRN